MWWPAIRSDAVAEGVKSSLMLRGSWAKQVLTLRRKPSGSLNNTSTWMISWHAGCWESHLTIRALQSFKNNGCFCEDWKDKRCFFPWVYRGWDNSITLRIRVKNHFTWNLTGIHIVCSTNRFMKKYVVSSTTSTSFKNPQSDIEQLWIMAWLVVTKSRSCSRETYALMLPTLIFWLLVAMAGW